MIIGNNISPLPFYNSMDEQNHNKDYAFGQVYPLIAHPKGLLPFQFIVNTSSASVQNVRLVNIKTDWYKDLIQEMEYEGALSVTPYSDMGISVIAFSGANFDYTFPPGQYQLSIRVSGMVYISEIFTVCTDISNYLRLEYGNSYDLATEKGVIRFGDGFKFVCYLNTQIGKPEYVFEEEATERMGYTFIESQVSKKIYKFTFLAPEYLCDALRIVRLCDTKQITSKGRTYDLTTFSMEPEWEEQGDLAAVECEFETDTVIANIGGYTKS